MDEKEFLNSLSPYFTILKEINTTILEINEENMDNEPNLNEEKMYKIVSQLLRVLPYTKIEIQEILLLQIMVLFN